jgi:hypothetical protein
MIETNLLDAVDNQQWSLTMLDQRYWRAIYNEERDAYVVEEAGWVDDEPQIEYRFSYFSDDEDEEIACLGGLDKWWLDDEGLAEGEFFAFGKYPDQAAFDADVEHIMQEAEQLAQDANLDFFLAVIDLVKERAVEAELDDDSLFEFEGVFAGGDEDAYSLRRYDPNRLHVHVERRQDECWRLHVAQVVDPQGQALGWSVCAVLYPDLTSAATDDTITAAQIARILDLNHFHAYSDAVISINGTLLFMTDGDRVEDPEYAYLDDSFVLELMSVQGSIEGVISPEWEVLEGDQLRAFLAGKRPLVREQEHWHPRQDDPVAQVAAAMGLPLHIADQLYAHLLDSLNLSDPLDEDSPWQTMNDSD